MIYLGCNNGDCKNIQIGVAVSKDGIKWVKAGILDLGAFDEVLKTYRIYRLEH